MGSDSESVDSIYTPEWTPDHTESLFTLSQTFQDHKVELHLQSHTEKNNYVWAFSVWLPQTWLTKVVKGTFTPELLGPLQTDRFVSTDKSASNRVLENILVWKRPYPLTTWHQGLRWGRITTDLCFCLNLLLLDHFLHHALSQRQEHGLGQLLIIRWDGLHIKQNERKKQQLLYTG